MHDVEDDHGLSVLVGEIENEPDPKRRVDRLNDLYDSMGRLLVLPVRRVLEGALATARSADYRPGMASTLGNLGWSCLDTDEYAAARSHFLEGLELCRELGDNAGGLRCLNGLGACYMDMGLFERAIVHYRDALKGAEQAKSVEHYGIILTNLAKCYIDLGQYDQAVQCLEQVVETPESRPLNRAIRQHRLGVAHRNRHQLAEAEEHLRLAMELAGVYDSLVVQCEVELALVRLESGQVAAAEALVRSTLSRSFGGKERRSEAEALLCLAQICQVQGKTGDAEKLLLKALALAEELGAGVVEVRACQLLAEHYRFMQSFKPALVFSERCRDLERRLARESNSLLASSLEEEKNRREAQLFREQYEQMMAIGEIGRHLTGSLDIESVLGTVYANLHRLLPSDGFFVGIYDEAAGAIQVRLGIEDGSLIDERSIAVDQASFVSWCFRSGNHILISDLERERDGYADFLSVFQFSGRPCASLIFVPLTHRDKSVGVVCAQSRQRGAFTQHHVNTLTALGAYLAIAIENAELFRRLQTLAAEDALTGCLNRRRLDEYGGEEFRRSVRYGFPLSVIMMDLDHFKLINDSYGHDVGDQALRHVAALAKAAMRDIDAVGRYGGEEFAFILPSTELAGCQLLAERIREAIAAEPLALPDGTAVALSSSFGVAQRNAGDSDFFATLVRADQALFRAKAGGRNRVCV